ncbi:hypothetical protein Smp_032720 [Schistosoma mansoni]|uniref:Uncharacterized protein n=1 Tax=Schistosoma mansoni TaxID=6183 RepID=G4VDH3_SCHMA|nr:hypothetical protein Smp_032720 [Schistosoma mansoni]|eukprot:XP_018649585.1 hypothetical protein Smp_032720 [Schistosoma mansoni]
MTFKVGHIMNYFDKQAAIEKIKAVLSERKTPYAFGSCQERSLYPESIPHHRLGVTLASINGNEFVGPTTYDIQTPDISEFNKKSISTRGYTLGARTARRMNNYLSNSDFSDPGAYQDFVNKTSSVRPNKKPFNQSTYRADKSLIDESIVGVGTYDVTKKSGQHVQWQMDTMLHPMNLPKIEQQSTILMNTDKLNTTTEYKRYQRKLAYLKLYYL